MKITKKAGKLIVQATAEELRKNPKLAAAIKKAQAGLPAPDSSLPADPAADLGGSGSGLELPGGDDVGGVSDDLGGVDAPTDGSVDGDLAGDPSEKFMSAVDKAFQDAFGKPFDENLAQIVRSVAALAGADSDKSPAVDDLDATDGQIPGGDLGGSDLPGADAPVGGAGGDPAAHGAGIGGSAPSGGADNQLMANSRGRLTKVASASEFVKRLSAHLAN